MGRPAHQPTHYDVLGLPQGYAPRAHTGLTPQLVKAAYRRSLLRHHPDKSGLVSGGSNIISFSSSSSPPPPSVGRGDGLRGANGPDVTYSVDQISEAYAVLSAPKRRAEYDRELRLRGVSCSAGPGAADGQSWKKGGGKEGDSFWTGMEVVDLDDLEFDENGGYWYRGCRCGDERGYLVREGDLEEVAEDGEIVVGCKGCSLWLKVLFGVIEEEEVQGDNSGEHG